MKDTDTRDALTNFPNSNELESSPVVPTSEFARLDIKVGDLVVFKGRVYYVDGFTFDERANEVVALSGYGEGPSGVTFAREGDVFPVIVSSGTACSAPEIEGSISGIHGGHWLYFFYDMTGCILYIGIAEDVLSRWKQHERDKDWFSEVVSFRRVWYATREAVLEAEKFEIKQKRPIYNIVHNERRSKAL